MNESTPAPFSTLGLDARLVRSATELGYEEPTAIQREAIPPLLDGRDVLGQAATGTGKTAAFTLPMLQRIAAGDGTRSGVRGMILVPTRELAVQVAEAAHKYGKLLDARVLPVYGGQSVQQQLRALRRGVDVVVATPGRALDHIRRGTLDLSSLQFLVLDEADEMLDMGFAEELDAIVDALPKERQTALFSATMASRVRTVAKKYLNDPVQVTIGAEKPAAGKKFRIRETAYVVQRAHKPAALARVIDMESPASAIVFCRTRTEVDQLSETLAARGYQAEAIHGGLTQEQRDRVLKRFREGMSDMLIATDVAARGLDIEHVSHVVNFDVPSSADAYVHRIGRTGRAGREGVAITLAEVREHRLLRNIEQQTKRKIAIEPVPTAHDLRARRLELTRNALQEAIEGGELDRYRVVVESLSNDYDVIDLAAAAVKLADRSRDGESDEADIPSVALVPQQAPAKKGERTTLKQVRPPAQNMGRIFVGLGRRDAIKPGDLVGAIAREGGIDARDIGAIDVAERFSLIEVPSGVISRVIRALRDTKIRGRKLGARLDRSK